MDGRWEGALRETAEAMHRVEFMLNNGPVSDEVLFTLLTGEGSRVKRLTEHELNTAYEGSRLAKRVDEFVNYLRERLGSEANGLPDAWVVKMFGFNLRLDERERDASLVFAEQLKVRFADGTNRVFGVGGSE